MGTSSILMTVGALILLVLLSLTFYSSYRSKSEINIYNQALITGSGIAQSIINEATSRAYDQKTVLKSYSTPDSLTSAGSLGPDTGEYTINQYNDVDDFNGYIRFDTLKVLGVFRTTVNVNYVARLNPDLISGIRTFSKRIDVKVTNLYIQDTIKVKYVITY